MDKDKFKQLFSEYCNSEIRKGRCNDGDCSFCVVNKSYEMIFKDRTDDVILAVEDALCEYSENNVDVMRNEETNMLDVIYHSSSNSFAIECGVACFDEVDIDALEYALDDLGVGHCW